MSIEPERQWYVEQRGKRFAIWVVMNIATLIVFYKTNSILWALVFAAVSGLIRHAPMLCQLDRVQWEINQKERPDIYKNQRRGVLVDE